jgi:nitroreductase
MLQRILMDKNKIEIFREIVQTRRSVRLFDGSAVPAEVVHQCLDLALLAPNSSNLQPWEFYWVRSPDKKAALVKACLSQAAANTAAELIVCVARTNHWEAMNTFMLQALAAHEKAGVRIPKAAWQYYRKLIPLAYRQGPLGIWGFFKRMLFFFVGLRKPTVREPASYADMKIWAVKSTALACENLMLAFRAFDFDTCPMEGVDSKRIHKLLALSSDAVTVMVIAIGKRRDAGVTLPQIRGEKSWFVKEV